MASSSSLSEYLKKYTSEEKPKSKSKSKSKSNKKEKPKRSVNAGGVRIVDEDAVWQAEIKEESSHEDSPDEKPQVTEDVEVKRMKRMEELKMHRPYLTVAEDGSGWVTVSQPKKSGLQSNDLSSKEQCSTDPSTDRRVDSTFLGNHSSSTNENQDNFNQKDLQSANRQPKNEGCTFSSDSKAYESNHLPQRKVRHDSPDLSPPRQALTKSPDLSPPRQCQKDPASYSLPQMKVRHDSPDISPPQKLHMKSPNISPQRKYQLNVGSCIPLPQRKGRNDSPDLSPPRKAWTKSPELLPSRKCQKDVGSLDTLPQMKVRHDSPDLIPPREASIKSVDLSPPRKRQKDAGSADPLQLTKVRHDSRDISPPRKAWTKSADSSPPRRHQKDIGFSRPLAQSKIEHDSPDLSPPRKHQDVLPDRKGHSHRKDSPTLRHFHARSVQIDDRDFSPPRVTQHNSYGRADGSPTKKQTSPPTRMGDQTFSERHVMKAKGKERMGDGTSAGLHTGKDLKDEIDQKKIHESQRFSKMDASLSGRGAETVYRDKQGKRLEGVEEFLQSQQGQAKPEEKPLEWGKGIAQKREAEARQAELELEKNKPFARSRDDPELDKMLKERIRWGDPMAHLVKKKNVEPILENLAEDEKMKESGFIVPQDIPSHSWLKRGVDPPPNRHGIKPGRHWDGVDRSNGFEKDLFKRQNEKRATETEAYLWSVADM